MNDSKVSMARVLTESVLGVAVTIAAALLIHRWISLANLAFIFLVPVILMAGKRGLAGGLMAALLATLGFNFFFVPPAFTFHVADVDNVATLFALALMAVLVSQFAARLKTQAEKATALAKVSEWLAALAQDLALCGDEGAVQALAFERIESWTGAKARLVDMAMPLSLSPLDAAAARWAHAHLVEAGRGTEVMAGADALYLPIEGNAQHVVQVWRSGAGQPVPHDQRDVLRQALGRYASALHRVTVEARAQREAVREAVLASIGHDLRTPLTGVIAGLKAIAPDAGGIVESTRTQAERLEGLMANILELARLRADALPQAREATDLTDAVDAALTSLASRLSGHSLVVTIAPDLPLVRSDARMLHHILLNLIDNAAKFSPTGSTITIDAARQDGVTLRITDQGRGVPDAQSGLPKRDDAEPVAGSGLGLTVVAGFAHALGIIFTMARRSDGANGTCATLTFPPPLCITPSA